ncbi:hypothetical protein K458DRAFT_391502 [Lentithecium fluviatile CBS 122367]|uniref:RRM domain-containing protein n=1 Tax=Lentithecium fluviatile CBS 122367 TaxID=1168545 RepID=A0A6G1IV46_9PLEO|nr:hypothetical protein K458DRAFT_391502 [Lentithecium fluviatile CBS 122367]
MNGDGYSRDGGRSAGTRTYSSRDDHRDRGGDRDRRRRRSRSPRQSSRRDYEVDTYSSSRDYREREREDTYARRERRDDRSWGDSYSRRERPRHDRDENRGPPRRDRDRDRDFEERGRGGRRDGGGFGGRDRKKSASPPVKKREPTPDLASYVSVLVRPRRMTQWDIKPEGYHGITAEQAKLSGMFPLPGAPRAAPMDPSKLAAFVSPSTGTASTSGLQPLNSKQAKRLFIYNLPEDVTSDEVIEFFNLQLNGLNVVSGHNPCVSAMVKTNHEYALVEFKAAEDATVALAMDGILMRAVPEGESAPEGLSIRRPKDYITPSAEDSAPSEGGISNVVNDSPYKLSIVHIPPYVEDHQVRELIETFGALKAFVMVKDTSSDVHRGIAFCEFEDKEILDQVIDSLNSIPLGDGHLKVMRATVGVKQQIGFDGGVGAISMLASSHTNENQEKSRVLCLLNMVTADELINDDDYEEIKEDVQEECEKYGPILEVKIPRPAGVRSSAGVGKIYIKYDTPESAQKAIKALAGRQFSRRTVVVTEFSEESFDVEAW